ncbi:Pro-kumamolisin, activation domain-containing protein [Mycena leptocephala]|nr:Pro-kumamolisin, activation domain-containing protein [Mycena leptocephala]
MRSTFLIFAPLLARVRASPTHVLHETRALVPRGYDDGGLVDVDTIVHFRIALAQSNISGLKDVLDEVSNPSSPRYGQYLSKEQIVEHIQPSPITISAIQDWLTSHNLASLLSRLSTIGSPSRPPSNKPIVARRRLRQLHTLGNPTLLHPNPIVLDSRTLKSHIEYITPTVSLPSLSPRIARPLRFIKARRSCYLHRLHHSGGSNFLGVGNIDGNIWLNTDISTFMHDYRPDNIAYDYVPSISTEALTIKVGLLNGIKVLNYFVGRPTHFGDPWTDLFYHIGNATLRPTVLTVSYDSRESDFSSATKQVHHSLTRICNAAMVLGNMGYLLSLPLGIEDREDSETLPAPVELPNSKCPSRLAVRMSRRWSNDPDLWDITREWRFDVQCRVEGFPRFSLVLLIRTPLWDLTWPIKTKYAPWQTSTGRALPDVSARHEGWVVANGDSDLYAVGTSMASPIFASVIALLNNELLAAGKPALGFLNPWLYSTASAAFKDITAGNSDNGCGTGGYGAVSGWDPVSVVDLSNRS